MMDHVREVAIAESNFSQAEVRAKSILVNFQSLAKRLCSAGRVTVLEEALGNSLQQTSVVSAAHRGKSQSRACTTKQVSVAKCAGLRFKQSRVLINHPRIPRTDQQRPSKSLSRLLQAAHDSQIVGRSAEQGGAVQFLLGCHWFVFAALSFNSLLCNFRRVLQHECGRDA